MRPCRGAELTVFIYGSTRASTRLALAGMDRTPFRLTVTVIEGVVLPQRTRDPERRAFPFPLPVDDFSDAPETKRRPPPRSDGSILGDALGLKLPLPTPYRTAINLTSLMRYNGLLRRRKIRLCSS